MTAYINGTGLISPQKTADISGFLNDIVQHQADYFKCIEPDYKTYLEPLTARRLSRLVKMGITTAKICLADAGCSIPDAIITGTGLGSLEDVEGILERIHDDSVPISPTPFMLSTYNTISSQIAIQLKCHGYNSTYVHRSFSFESGLMDAMMLLEEKSAANVLVGGIDEMVPNHHALIRRLGHWKMNPVDNLQLLAYKTPGAVPGEGSGHFLLSSQNNEHSYATIRGVKTFYQPESFEESKDQILNFLASSGLNPEDIDIFLTGINADTEFDPIYFRMAQDVFPEKPLAWFKHLSGEFYTATLFALWTAANILKRQEVPPVIILKYKVQKEVRNILIYNQYRNVHHSLILVGKK
ncbi:MAG: beta-ketoacyl synthase chain length factor [Bacteroidetes bacterium]|nr:beta-ketoacyl synthase chain length factor [Bacteroidota bacterium]